MARSARGTTDFAPLRRSLRSAEKEKFLEMLRKMSPVAWQHIHFLGHYLFRNDHQPIDLEAILDHAGFD